MEKLHIQNFTKRTLQAKSPMFIRVKLRPDRHVNRVKLEMCTFGDRRRGHTKAPNLPPGLLPLLLEILPGTFAKRYSHVPIGTEHIP